MNIKARTVLLVAAFCAALNIKAQKVECRADSQTGALQSLTIDGDPAAMNWIVRTDGTQYRWMTKKYGWGLGFLTVNGRTVRWEKPVSRTGGALAYKAGVIDITVKRNYAGNDLVESYTFRNAGKQTAKLTDVGINTPFNDNYPDAATCMTSRCNAHIWAGGSASYVNMMRMGGKGPHLGMVLTQGSIRAYEENERSRQTGQSNFRGAISLVADDVELAPGRSYTVAWRLFAHAGWDDFTRKMVALGGVAVSSEKFVYEKGERAAVTFTTKSGARTLYPSTQTLGNKEVVFAYGRGKKAKAEILVVSKYDNLLKRRAEFIVKHQQMQNASDKRYGAYMVYDNETDKIYLNDTPNCNPVDRDEGRERVGMGVFLARMYQKYGGEDIKKSLLEYAAFVRKLQDKDYKTYSNTDLKGWNRNYNYSWIATFYFEMFRITGEKQFLKDGYCTLKALYRQFGHGFYAIDMPVQGCTLLRDNGFKAEADTLLNDFRLVADAYVKTGSNYPKSEVNYEQAIVAPSVIHLLRVYQLTREQKYLDGAKALMPLLESFCGRQPSYHLNDIAIRHWDGFWFGKKEYWGDTFPHYWSTLNAEAYDLYAQITGDKSYARRARNILLNNLCLFTEDGRGSCAYIYPYKVDGKPGQFYDPFANDQDWALAFYLEVLKD